MTIDEILNDEGLTFEQRLSKLTEKTISVPAWAKLQKEYDPCKHPVMTDHEYVDKVTKGHTERMTRIILGWQKLATKRMSALLCGIPVKRLYNPSNDQEKRAAAVIEGIYQRNRIDAVNLERAKMLYAACENITIWFAQESPTNYGGETSALKLRCRNYSPIKGDELYPLFDEYDDLIALSVKYQRTENAKVVSYFDTYTSDRHICWNLNEKSVVTDEEITIGKIPGVYIHRKEPIWEDMSQNVYEAEWTYSRNGNYIRKNSRPTLAVMTNGDVKTGKAPQGDNVSRDVVRLGQNDKLEYVTWEASNEALKFHIEELKHNFNSQLQLPDTSMDNMKSSPMSGESRKMLFMDSQMKVTDESGIWTEYYDREINVIRAFAKVMFPGLASAIDSLVITHMITPYQIRDEKERVETLSVAAGGAIASRLTAIRRLGWADDADEEARLIAEDNNGDIFQPMQ